MTLATFDHLTRVTADVTVERREWALPVAGRFGQATIRIPYGSPAASPDAINADGGSWVTIHDTGGSGVWPGIVGPVTFDETAAVVTAFQPWVLLQHRGVRPAGTYRNVAAGLVAYRALNDALAGLPWFHLAAGGFDGGVVIDEPVTFQGQDAWSVLTGLMEASDQELYIDPETGRVEWCGAFTQGQLYPTLLVEGVSLLGVAYSLDPTGQASQVTAINNLRTFTVINADVAVAGWPATVTVGSERGGAALRTLAQRESDRRSQPLRTLTGTVTAAHWAIREGDFVRCLIKRLGWTGGIATCRVLSRDLDEASGRMTLGLQLYEVSDATRSLPPGIYPDRRGQLSIWRTRSRIRRLQHEVIF